MHFKHIVLVNKRAQLLEPDTKVWRQENIEVGGHLVFFYTPRSMLQAGNSRFLFQMSLDFLIDLTAICGPIV
jgi:hypothetical protein